MYIIDLVRFSHVYLFENDLFGDFAATAMQLQEVPKAWATRMNFHEPLGCTVGQTSSEKHMGVVSKWILAPLTGHLIESIWDAFWIFLESIGQRNAHGAH